MRADLHLKKKKKKKKEKKEEEEEEEEEAEEESVCGKLYDEPQLYEEASKVLNSFTHWLKEVLGLYWLILWVFVPASVSVFLCLYLSLPPCLSACLPVCQRASSLWMIKIPNDSDEY